MASVNFEKFKANQIKAVMRHCDKEERKQRNHSNKQINKQVTDTNLQYDRSYEETCKRYDERIAYLDSFENANKRKDRVTCLGITVPTPKGLDATEEFGWFNKVNKIVKKQFGANNVLQCYIHRDEVHQYRNAETGQLETSRVHAHFFVVPERDNKLVGKHVCNRENFIKLDNSLQDMTVSDYGIDFMDGSKKKSKATVEELKGKSASREYRVKTRKSITKQVTERLESDYEARRKLLEAQARKRELEFEERVTEQNRAFQAREADLQEREQAVAEQEKEFQGREDRLQAQERALKIKRKDIQSMTYRQAVEIVARAEARKGEAPVVKPHVRELPWNDCQLE